MIEAVVQALIVLVSIYCGYKMGKGEPIITKPVILKRVVRNERQEAELIKKLEREQRIKK